MFFSSQAIFKWRPMVPQVSFSAGLSKSREKKVYFWQKSRKILQLWNLEGYSLTLFIWKYL